MLLLTGWGLLRPVSYNTYIISSLFSASGKIEEGTCTITNRQIVIFYDRRTERQAERRSLRQLHTASPVYTTYICLSYNNHGKCIYLSVTILQKSRCGILLIKTHFLPRAYVYIEDRWYMPMSRHLLMVSYMTLGSQCT